MSWANLSRWSILTAFAIIAFCGVVALVAPADVLDRLVLLKAFAHAMADVFPVVSHYASRSSFPQVTMLYLALTLSASPVFYVAGMCAVRPRSGAMFVPVRQVPLRGTTYGKYLRANVVFALIVPPLAYFQLFVNPGLDFGFLRFSTSTVVLALSGWALTGGIVCALGASNVMMIRLALGVRGIAASHFLQWKRSLTWSRVPPSDKEQPRTSKEFA